jgi:hypothetical protein
MVFRKISSEKSSQRPNNPLKGRYNRNGITFIPTSSVIAAVGRIPMSGTTGVNIKVNHNDPKAKTPRGANQWANEGLIPIDGKWEESTFDINPANEHFDETGKEMFEGEQEHDPKDTPHFL